MFIEMLIFIGLSAIISWLSFFPTMLVTMILVGITKKDGAAFIGYVLRPAFTIVGMYYLFQIMFN